MLQHAGDTGDFKTTAFALCDASAEQGERLAEEGADKVRL